MRVGARCEREYGPIAGWVRASLPAYLLWLPVPVPVFYPEKLEVWLIKQLCNSSDRCLLCSLAKEAPCHGAVTGRIRLEPIN